MNWKDFVIQKPAEPPPAGCSNPAALVPVSRKTKLDHALGYASRGLHVFACDEFLGLPLIDNWYGGATDKREQVVHWWSNAPTADIAAVPEKSGHYVIIVTGQPGRESLALFESEHGTLKPAFRYCNHWDCEHLWFVGSSHSARIGEGLHLIGAGRYVYLSPSLAPDPTAWRK